MPRVRGDKPLHHQQCNCFVCATGHDGVYACRNSARVQVPTCDVSAALDSTMVPPPLPRPHHHHHQADSWPPKAIDRTTKPSSSLIPPLPPLPVLQQLPPLPVMPMWTSSMPPLPPLTMTKPSTAVPTAILSLPRAGEKLPPFELPYSPYADAAIKRAIAVLEVIYPFFLRV